MLSQRDLNALIRDERAWKRAITRSDAEDRDSAPTAGAIRHAPPELLRRGCVENVQSVHFLSELRAPAMVAGGEAPVPDGMGGCAWSGSTRITSDDGVDHDLLYALLQRSVKSRGLAAAEAATARPSVTKNSHRNAAATHAELSRHEDWASRLLLCHRLNGVEAAQRASICRGEARNWAAFAHAAVERRIGLLVDDEYLHRRALFREAMEEKVAILDCEAVTFTQRTGVDHETFARTRALFRAEHQRRRGVVRAEERTRGMVCELALIEERRLIDQGIVACARCEQRLLSVMAVRK